jgi:hypothetical protein
LSGLIVIGEYELALDGQSEGHTTAAALVTRAVVSWSSDRQHLPIVNRLSIA